MELTPASKTDQEKSATYHKAVLISETLEYLALKPDSVYIDATFGGGSHTAAILDADPTIRVIALDWDIEAIEQNGPLLKERFGDRLTLIWGNFAHLLRLLKKEGVESVDGILADLGTSQHQIHHRKGFSFQKDSPLDMRMSPAHQYLKAADILNRYQEQALSKIFFELGEDPNSRAIARAIVEQRKLRPYATTSQLAETVQRVVGSKKSHTHPATRIFQALRMYINKELDNIEHFLKATPKVLVPGGRLVCISFHSLEDRLVKTYLRENTNLFSILTKKPITASEDELSQNPSSRSAKLRAAERLASP